MLSKQLLEIDVSTILTILQCKLVMIVFIPPPSLDCFFLFFSPLIYLFLSWFKVNNGADPTPGETNFGDFTSRFAGIFYLLAFVFMNLCNVFKY